MNELGRLLATSAKWFGFCGLVLAPISNASGWDKEPTSVLGIELGAPIPASVPQCPGRDSPLYMRPASLCLSGNDSPYAGKIRNIEGLPFRDMAIRGTLELFEGKVVRVLLDIRHDEDYPRMAAILVERYGEPTVKSTTEVTVKSGVRLTSEIWSWAGNTNSITLRERSGRIDRSLVIFSNIPLSEAESREAEAKTKKDASEL